MFHVKCYKVASKKIYAVFKEVMKRNKLENKLKDLGWWLLRHGGNHDIWTDGDRQEPIPRH